MQVIKEMYRKVTRGDRGGRSRGTIYARRSSPQRGGFERGTGGRGQMMMAEHVEEEAE